MNSSSVSESTSAASVSPTWDAILEPRSRGTLERVLPAYVVKRRWYRTKTERVQSARIIAAFPLAYGGGENARIALVELTLESGGRDTYVLPLAYVSGEAAAAVHAARPDAQILPLHVTDAERRTSAGFVVDALALEGVLKALLEKLAKGGEIEDAGMLLRFHPLADAFADENVGAIQGRLLDAEQTNSSILFGDRFVGKVVRKLDSGESPDLEISRFLTAAGYTHAPPLAGSVDVIPAGETTIPPSTVAVFARFVPNRGDAWTHCLQELSNWLGEIEQMGDSTPPKLPPNDILTRALFPLPDDIVVAVGPYPRAAALLGSRVGEMHKLLSRTHIEAFVPEPLGGEARQASRRRSCKISRVR
ncbi:MAG TPA: hypothetical protein VM925_19710 [Labilithrix sp.]|nr:hypothetical protein [Labilithrix sp.]